MGNTAVYWYFCSLEAVNAIQGEKWRDLPWYTEVAVAVPFQLTSGLWRLPIWDDGYFLSAPHRFDTSRQLIRSGNICGAFVMQSFLSTMFTRKKTIFGNVQLLKRAGIKVSGLTLPDGILEMTLSEARGLGLLGRLLI